ncbi:MAG: hypothetical protein JXL81_11955 [Deltaproteobacteria bacterium]|nr:hypothetical protein [Deltaproteobacteria bacterium]
MDLVAGAFASQEDEKMEEKKVCSNCGKEKPINEFTKNPGCRGGREGQCKQCRLEKAKARRWAKDVTKKDPVVERKKKKQQAVTGENKELSTKLLPPKDDAICIARAGFPLSMDIARLEAENAESIQEAAKYIIASVKKDLLGAVFQELRSK